jgi:ubiquinone biosynthesis protein Coq4
MSKEKINTELLEKLPPETLGELYDELHEVLCETTIKLLKDTLEEPELT